MKALVVANWKMNPRTAREAKKLFSETKRMATLLKVPVIVAPPAIFLRDLAALQRGRAVSLAAQNVHFETSGSYTGEISADQVRDAKAAYVLVGHAERRAIGETNNDVRTKVRAVLSADMIPIVCIGEHERTESGEHFMYVREQLLTALMDAPAQAIARIVIAYEPVWAIGAPAPMRPHDMHEMSIYIKKALVEKYGDVGHKVQVLYGGAVDASNVQQMLQDGDVKGLLVGRASIESSSFADLLRAVKEA